MACCTDSFVWSLCAEYGALISNVHCGYITLVGRRLPCFTVRSAVGSDVLQLLQLTQELGQC